MSACTEPEQQAGWVRLNTALPQHTSTPALLLVNLQFENNALVALILLV